ncbi:cytochrome c-type biogenesis protein CcmH [Acidithrix sp. C25]|uniref:cytochrome c-type biogenesis protein CcmH n=1 Tax=Acidithrix sp. C25 TaxID=1671482 RepID=UPI00191B9230|nr:cytochrome c-type biogenesis protein CcmH [Acidithrix sp. C25]CAG4929786.1 unnamed protein product [Acidithrix sp. C25]
MEAIKLDPEISENGQPRPKRFAYSKTTWRLSILMVIFVVTIFGYLFLSPHKVTMASRISHLEAVIKCPTCISVSTKDANTSSAYALRAFISQMVHSGASDSEIINQLVATYGPSILLTPPNSNGGLYLAVFGGLVAIAGPIGGFLYYRRRRSTKMESSLESHDGQEVDSAVRVDYLGVSDLNLVDDSTAPISRPVVSRRSFEIIRRATWPQRIVAVVGVVLVLSGAGLLLFSLTTSSAAAGGLSVSQVALDIQNGQDLASVGSDTAALSLFSAVLHSEPSQPVALAWNGWLLLQAGNKDKSNALRVQGLAQLSRSVQVDPSYIYGRLFYGIALFTDQGNPNAAVRQFDAFFKLSPSAALLKQVHSDIASAYKAAHLLVPS